MKKLTKFFVLICASTTLNHEISSIICTTANPGLSSAGGSRRFLLFFLCFAEFSIFIKQKKRHLSAFNKHL